MFFFYFTHKFILYFILIFIEARIAIARATSVFIMYLSSNAAAVAHKHNHKTFSAQDVIDSINEMDFKNFIAPMKSSLITYQKSMKDKKDNKKISLEARKSSGNQNESPPTASISPTKAVTNKKTVQIATTKPLITISSDIIEIDDSD